MPAYQDPGVVEFDAVIENAGGGGAFVNFPHSVPELFGVKGRVPVVAAFDGVEYRGSLVKMGGDCHIMPILKEIRERLGKGPGDTVHVTLRLDKAPRMVELPEDAAAALAAHPDALAAFNRLSYTHQREYVRWIEEAKRAETRQQRIRKMVEML